MIDISYTGAIVLFCLIGIIQAVAFVWFLKVKFRLLEDRFLIINKSIENAKEQQMLDARQIVTVFRSLNQKVE